MPARRQHKTVTPGGKTRRQDQTAHGDAHTKPCSHKALLTKAMRARPGGNPGSNPGGARHSQRDAHNAMLTTAMRAVSIQMSNGAAAAAHLLPGLGQLDVFLRHRPEPCGTVFGTKPVSGRAGQRADTGSAAGAFGRPCVTTCECG